MSKLRVESLQGPHQLQGIRSEWQALCDSSFTSPFLCWEWISTWQKWFGHNRMPYILCVRDHETLIGIMALGKESISAFPIGPKITRLTFLGEQDGGADYLDIASAPERSQECVGAIFDYLLNSGEFDLLDLDGLPTDSALLPMSSSRCWGNRDFVYKLTPRFTCPQINLADGWEQILRRSRRADNFKRRLRGLRSRDGFDFRTITSPDETSDAFERFLALHDACWAHRGGSGATGTEAKREFQREIVREMSRINRIRFDELWVEGKCRASIYGMENGPTYYFYLSGYDLSWSGQSVGLVLLGLSIESAASRGVLVYDFLRGAETYKFDWANHSRMTAAIRIAANKLPARWIIARDYLSESLRAWIPNSAKETAQNARHFLRRNSDTPPHEAKQNGSMIPIPDDTQVIIPKA